ncbi:N-acetylmuramoyl-L-alanine amidase [Phaeovulum sp.]|uniref:N-acetylmuramoyl-L-alanine amidase n=1 Tax=Phaeovulum sp. TaxID=2934796 RepID=UPI003569435F
MQRILWVFALVVLAFGAPFAAADELRALSRLDMARSSVVEAADGKVNLTLGLSQPIPYRAYLLDAPPRLVMEFSELDFAGRDPGLLGHAGPITALSWGAGEPGWTRLVAELAGPMAIETTGESTGAEPAITLSLVPVTIADFAARVASAPINARAGLPDAAIVAAPRRRQTGDTPLVVVLDPGHGGVDPGAEAEGLTEAQLMLGFARELKEVLVRAGMRAVLTREEDVFVPLEARMSAARAAGADVLLSLHADALAEGEAVGATIYLLATEASDAASARLAERHDRADLLAGVDLAGHDDVVAEVLMDLARAETQPRADGLAVALQAAILGAGLKMHKKPVQAAAFSVLKSPDIPSLLLELGFMSSAADRARLTDPAWRATMAAAIAAALQAWAVVDAAEVRYLRQ